MRQRPSVMTDTNGSGSRLPTGLRNRLRRQRHPREGREGGGGWVVKVKAHGWPLSQRLALTGNHGFVDVRLSGNVWVEMKRR